MATPITGAPTIAERDAQAPRQHNLGLRHLEVVAVGAVLAQVATEPVDPADGDTYIVAASATAGFSGQDHSIAYFVEPLSAWFFIVPKLGMVFYDVDTSTELRFNGTAWVTA